MGLKELALLCFFVDVSMCVGVFEYGTFWEPSPIAHLKNGDLNTIGDLILGPYLFITSTCYEQSFES